MANQISLLFLFSAVLLATELPDSLTEQNFNGYLQSKKIIHHPEEIMFQGRNYNLELIVDIPDDSIESVNLFIRTDTKKPYQEISLKRKRGIYSLRFDPEVFPGLLVQYFFIVQLSDYSLFAIPVDNNGAIQPVERTLVDAVEYYKLK